MQGESSGYGGLHQEVSQRKHLASRDFLQPLEVQLTVLRLERERLLEDGANGDELERNRLAIKGVLDEVNRTIGAAGAAA